jgi:hypothetical protein
VEQFFASLSKRQTMLLLTSLAFGGSDAIACYEHLALEEEELLKHRAQNLLQIPRDKRIPLVIQEIKRIITARRRNLANADPKRLAALLSKERGALVEVVLRALPSDLADACRTELGPRTTVKIVKEVRPDILSIVRWKLEEGLKQGAPQVGTFRFTDLLMMPQREVISICDRMGARVLATAVAGLADADREAFVGKLPPDQKALALKAAEAGKARRLSEADAKTVLEIHGGIENPSSGMRSAGAQRLMRAAIAQSQEFAQRFAERHQGAELGKLMQRWYREEKNKPLKGDGGRLDIVEQMERLGQKGVIDRPLRLPPPIRPPGPPPGAPPVLQAVPAQARRSLPNLPQVPSRSDERARSSQPQPSQAPARRPEGPRRDPIAERNARRAGVASARAPSGSTGQHRPLQDPASSSNMKRIMRDGKPLQKDPMATSLPQAKVPRRAVTSPAVQEPPKRRERNPDGSPIVRGTTPGKGGGRGGNG